MSHTKVLDWARAIRVGANCLDADEKEYENLVSL